MLVFKRRRQRLPDEQPESRSAPAIPVQAALLVLQTFEHRRNQLTTKSTICATAASGIVVLVIQVFLANPATPIPVRGLGLLTLCLAALALLEGLNVIKKLPKKTRSKRSRKHLLFFGTFVALTADEAYEKVADLSEEDYARELAAQAVELSRNLRMRYDALGKAHRWLSTAIVVFVLALVVQQVYIVAALIA
ncbi:Pycsar system effector family protein [Actinosynnema sp. NPDC023794]